MRLRLVQLYSGLVLYGVSSSLLVLAGLGLVHVAVAIARILGQAEVDKRAVPCVAEGHCSAYVRL